MTNKLHDFLNQEVANFTVLYEKLHHYHWFVKGSSFFTLHEKFEEDYTEVTGLVDVLAERLLMIGGVPISTLREYLERTTLQENQKNTKSSQDMVSNLILDYKQLVNELKVGIELAGDLGDSVTEDMFISISSSFEKKIWLYEAFAQ